RRSGPLEHDILVKIRTALALSPSDISDHQWVDNGPGWCAVMLRSAGQVLSLRPDWAALAPLKVGVVGPHEAGHDAAFEVRAFVGGSGYEDPVAGSLNASLAQWLIGAGLAASPMWQPRVPRFGAPAAFTCAKTAMESGSAAMWLTL